MIISGGMRREERRMAGMGENINSHGNLIGKPKENTYTTWKI